MVNYFRLLTEVTQVWVDFLKNITGVPAFSNSASDPSSVQTASYLAANVGLPADWTDLMTDFL